MSPDDLETRLRAVEANVRVLDGRVENLTRLMDRLMPISTQTAVLAQKIETLDSDMGDIRDEFRSRTDRLQALAESERDERRRIAEAERHEAESLRERREVEKRKDFQWKVITLVTILLGVATSTLGILSIVLN